MSIRKEEEFALPFWKEYPERDTEFVRLYPTLYNALAEDEIWEKNDIVFYVHIPFCNNACVSCPFQKSAPKDFIVKKYIESVKAEISNYASRPYIKDFYFSAGYIGGAVPTSIDEQYLVDLLSHLSREFDLKDNIEISIETTPIDISEQKLEALMGNGVNRVSIGVQSFIDDELKHIGKAYDCKKALETIKMLKRTKANVNVDLMYGLPGQTNDSWDKTLQFAIDAGVDCISFYRYFLIETSSVIVNVMSKKIPAALSNEEREKLFFYAADKLNKSGYSDYAGDGFEGYFGDSFSRPGKKSKYMEKSWGQCRDVVGLGNCALGRIKRHWYINESEINKYMSKVNNGNLPLAIGGAIAKEDDLRRTMALGVKTGKVSRRLYKDLYGIDFTLLFADVIGQLEEWGLVKLTADNLEVLAPKGWYYLANISKAFFAQKCKRKPQPLGQIFSIR